MTNSKKLEDKVSKASATELEESDLDNVEGGAAFLKLDSETSSKDANRSSKAPKERDKWIDILSW